jgi:hypothetical protein
MAATQTISNEIMADIQDPNGQINTAISGAQQQINADQQNTNTIGE